MITSTILLSVVISTTLPPKVDFLYPAGGQSGQKTLVQLGGTFEKWPLKAWASHPGIRAQADAKPGYLQVAVDPQTPRGIHYIRAFNDEGASVPRPFFVGDLPEIVEREPNDDFKKPNVLALDSSVVHGKLEKNGDVDVYSVALKKGQTLVASVEAFRVLKSPMDGILQILNKDGFVLAQNHDFYDIDPHVALSIPKDDIYLVRIQCFPAVPDSGVRFSGKDTFIYRLTVTTGPFLERVWPMAVDRRKPGNVELQGWNIPEDKKILNIEPGEEDEIRIQPAGWSGFASVRVAPHATAIATGKDIVLEPTTFSGRFDQPGTVHTFTVPGKKGLKIAAQIEARGLHFSLDPVLRWSGPGVKTLDVQPKTLNVDPSFEGATVGEGPYLLELRDLHREASPRHVYRLTIGTPRPDFDATVTTDRFATKVGQPLEIPVTVVKKNGFADEVALEVEGLPEAVSATVDPKTSKIKLLAKEPMGVAFRVAARAKDAVRRARASGGDLPAPTTWLWLTATR